MLLVFKWTYQMRGFFWRPKAHYLTYWWGKHQNFYAMKDCLTWPMWHTKMHFSAKCNSGRIAIQWFHIEHYLDYQYTKFQPYTFRVQKMCVFARDATLVPRLQVTFIMILPVYPVRDQYVTLSNWKWPPKSTTWGSQWPLKIFLKGKPWKQCRCCIPCISAKLVYFDNIQNFFCCFPTKIVTRRYRKVLPYS